VAAHSPVIDSTYTAPWWLPGGHAQTIFPALAGRRMHDALTHSYVRERWLTEYPNGAPDGDFIDVDFLPWIDGAPLVVLFHGLEGSSSSHYALALMNALKARAWNGCVAHFRGCSGEMNRLPRAYHSGDSTEIGWIIRRLIATRAPARLYAAGVSLGGNALAKWAAEQGDAAKPLVGAVVSVSSPLDLAACGKALGSGFNMIYTRMFLNTLKKKGAEKLQQHPGIYDIDMVLGARDLYAFDNLVTAPLHGFRDTDDYYARASAKPLLKQVRVPMLLINAKNDPFYPAYSLPVAADVSSSVTLEQPACGGHAGFAQGALPPGNIAWLPQRLLQFFDLHR
jgi:uncharacterized protein